MKGQLTLAIVTIISALVFYTIGVWSERFAGRLTRRHLVLFVLGLVCDTTGTTLMGEIAGRMDFDIHGITGAIAIILMLSHAAWAAFVLLAQRERALQNFHKFSTTVWLIWLVPFVTGMAGAMLH